MKAMKSRYMSMIHLRVGPTRGHKLMAHLSNVQTQSGVEVKDEIHEFALHFHDVSKEGSHMAQNLSLQVSTNICLLLSSLVRI